MAEVDRMKMESNGIFPPDYLNIISMNKVSIHGYLLQLDQLDDLLERHKQFTSSVFYIKTKDTYFGRRNRIFSSSFLTESKTLRTRIKYEVYRCRYGRANPESKTQRIYEKDRSKVSFLQGSLLRDCPAVMQINEFIIFTDFQDDGNKVELEEKKKRILIGESNDFKDLNTIRYIEVILPLASAHSNHNLSQDDLQVGNLTGMLKRKTRSDKGTKREKSSNNTSPNEQKIKKKVSNRKKKRLKTNTDDELFINDENYDKGVVMTSLEESDEQLVVLSLSESPKVVHIFSGIQGLNNMVQNVLSCVEVRAISFTQNAKRSDEIILYNEDLEELKQIEILLIDSYLFTIFKNEMPNLKWVQITEPYFDIISNNITEDELPCCPLTKSLSEEYCDMISEFLLGSIIQQERNLSNNITLKIDNIIPYGHSHSFRTLDELTVTVLGLDTVGHAVSVMLRNNNCKVLGYAQEDTTPSSYLEFLSDYWYGKDLCKTLENTDVIINTFSSTSSLKNLLGNTTLLKTKKCPYFINIGSLDIIEEDCLLKSLDAKCLSKAIIYNREHETIHNNSKLRFHQKVEILDDINSRSRLSDITVSFATNWQKNNDGYNLLEEIKTNYVH